MFGPARRVSRRTARRTTRRVNRRQDMMQPESAPEPEYAAPAPQAPAEPDYTAELESLAQLKAEGILTDEEFQAKKKQILGI